MHPLPDSMVALLQGEMITALPVLLGFIRCHLQKKKLQAEGQDFPLSDIQLTPEIQDWEAAHPGATTASA